MNEAQLDCALEVAESVCKQLGRELSTKRQRVLQVLLQSSRPVSAYEITSEYNKLTTPAIKAMSVYRILEFLTSANLAHKLESTNKFIACKQDCDNHQHPYSLFLICDECEQVSEICSTNEFIEQLGCAIGKTKFTPNGHQLEIIGRCASCQTSQNS
ncbi:Fur family transcriptional regulator [Planctobacterium marinum]|uniref:Transcriptional repressor n=1 Tax=Planctobacterium marinum TaxID=1631968 RepID=A0AA48HIH2_9ALTE|nr:transcriptional repressor [Planctobacterium marinum]